MENFYVICPLNLEKVVIEEINEKFKHYFGRIPETAVETGGISIKCELIEGYQLNTILKCATRVLLRIKEQKCRDFPKLFKIIQKIDWKKYSNREEIDFDITTKESRLINTTKMNESCLKGVEKYYNANKLPAKILDNKENYSKTKVYIRVLNDDMQISLDTSGDALYLRGNDPFRGLASIRSTIASGLVYRFLKDKKNINLIDPMCGSGTFIKEARDFYKVNRDRKYYFQELIEHKYLEDMNEKIDITSSHGYDLDANIIKKNNIDSTIADVFKLTLEKDCIIICNPPYGKRVKLSKPREIFYLELIKRMKNELRATEISILLPLDIKLKEYKKKTKIFNSGIWLYNYEI
jgi:putative N6-adenine-specific DNA methylase